MNAVHFESFLDNENLLLLREFLTGSGLDCNRNRLNGRILKNRAPDELGIRLENDIESRFLKIQIGRRIARKPLERGNLGRSRTH